MSKFQVINISRCFGYSWILLGHVALFYLIIQQEWTLLLLSLFMHYLISQFGISLTYHRSISHSAVDLPIWIESLGVFLAGLSLQGGPIAWATVHRQHHARQNTSMDPHSPKKLGSIFIHLFGYSFSKIDARYAVKLMQIPRYVWWHKYYYWIYLPILFGSFLCLPVNLALSLFWAPIAIVFQFENFVNTWTHSWNQDIPVNVPLANLFVLGEAYHKSHHDNPQNLIFHQHDILGVIANYFFNKKYLIKKPTGST